MTFELPWWSCAERLPPDGVVVETKVDAENGMWNVQELKRQGRLWFVPDGQMYVYYVPTHWRPKREDLTKAIQADKAAFVEALKGDAR